MAKLDITERILRYLRAQGVGYYGDISSLIQSGFPLQISDWSDEIYNRRIREYLDNLERSKYIKCKNVLITLEAVHVEAAILDAGVNHIRPGEKSKFYKFVEFLFWLAGIGVLVFIIYDHYHRDIKASETNSKTPLIIVDSTKSRK